MNAHVGIGPDLHRFPAQRRAMTFFISSIDNDGAFSRFRKLKTSEMLPFFRAAFTVIR
jgi:hypothetical protein